MTVGCIEWRMEASEAKQRQKDCIKCPWSRGSSHPRDQTQVFRITGRFFTLWATTEAQTISLWFNCEWILFILPPNVCREPTMTPGTVLGPEDKAGG